MTNLIKLGDKYLNLDLIQSVLDHYPAHKANELNVRFGPDDKEAFTFTGQEAENLRTWLNSTVQDLSHLHLDTDNS